MQRAFATIDIDAAPDIVWAVIIDTENHATFDPTCARVLGGTLEDGARLVAYSTLDPERPFRALVTTFSPPRRMAWSGARWFGLLKRRRSFGIDPLPGNRSRFTIKEDFTGRLAGPMRRSLPDMTEAFAGFCLGLKELAEAMAAVRRKP